MNPVEGSSSLLERAQQARERALEEQKRHIQQCIQAELQEAGVNPVDADPAVQEGCVLYLELRVMEYAALGRDEAVILYTEVPAIQHRLQKTKGLLHIQDRDMISMTGAIAKAFVRKHGTQIGFTERYMGNSFRITWF